MKRQFSSSKVWKYVHKLHSRPGDFSEGDLSDRIWEYGLYNLELVPISKLDPQEYFTDDWRVDEYVALYQRRKKYPPIVLTSYYSVIDGAHRLNALIKCGKTRVWCLVADPETWAGQAEEDEEETQESEPVEEYETLVLPAKDILTSRRSYNMACRDNAAGQTSRTPGPLSVWRLEDGRYLLVDGQHRFAEGIAKGYREFAVKVVGEGYSDYWATPSPDDEFRLPD